jgi:hypothetical protein
MKMVQSHVNAIEALQVEAKAALAAGEVDRAVALVAAISNLNKWLAYHVEAEKVSA